MNKIAPALALAATLNGCAPLHVAADYRLPLPERPALPSIEPDEVRCLKAETWRKIVMRDAKLRHHADELRAIIEATHNRRARP